MSLGCAAMRGKKSRTLDNFGLGEVSIQARWEGKGEDPTHDERLMPMALKTPFCESVSSPAVAEYEGRRSVGWHTIRNDRGWLVKQNLHGWPARCMLDAASYRFVGVGKIKADGTGVI
jgi:hypothetical protein